MSQPARKPGEPLPDDPSIPVLTERLTLPPLDLDLDFRLPPRPQTPPAEGEQDLATPRPADDDATRLAQIDDATRYAPWRDERRDSPAADDVTRYAARDDDFTRIAPQGRGPSEAAVEGPLTGQPAALRENTPGPDTRGPYTRGPDTRGPDTRGPDTRGPDTRGPDTRGPDTRGTDTRGPDTRGPETRGPDTRGFDTRRPDKGTFSPHVKNTPGVDLDAGPHRDRPSVLGMPAEHQQADDATRIAPAMRGLDTRGPDTRGPDTRGPDTRGLDTRGPDTRGPDTRSGPQTLMPAEPVEDGPRVPTSLLVSNVTAMMATPAPRHRRPQPDDFDLTLTDPGESLNQLDAELRERILLDLARRLPAEIDTIVRRHLDTAIEEAVRRFAAEVRIALAGSLREIVDRAVQAELERVKQGRR